MRSVVSAVLRDPCPNKAVAGTAVGTVSSARERQVIEPEARPERSGLSPRWFDWGVFLWKCVAALASSQGPEEVTHLCLPRPSFRTPCITGSFHLPVFLRKV